MAVKSISFSSIFITVLVGGGENSPTQSSRLLLSSSFLFNFSIYSFNHNEVFLFPENIHVIIIQPSLMLPWSTRDALACMYMRLPCSCFRFWTNDSLALLGLFQLMAILGVSKYAKLLITFLAESPLKKIKSANVLYHVQEVFYWSLSGFVTKWMCEIASQGEHIFITVRNSVSEKGSFLAFWNYHV